MRKKTLAIFSPNQNAYSETFIQAHKNLPFNIKFYYNGLLPNSLEGVGEIIKNSRINRIRNRLNKNFSIPEQALINSIKKEKVDCVLAEYGQTGVHTLNIVKFLNLPLIVHFFGHDASMRTVIEEYGEKYKQVFEYAKYVLVVSQKMKQDIIELGCPEKKIVLTYCGPDNIFYNALPHFKTAQFLSIGRFVDKKAPYLTIAAFKMVVSKFPKARLIMVGDGVLLNTCRNLVRMWEIEGNVDFSGIRNPSEIFKLFEESLAFVQHSIIDDKNDSEGTPVAVLDAQAASLPVISTYHAGIADVIKNDETGLLVKEHDVEGMSKNMIRVLEEKGLAQNLGLAGRKRVLKYFSMEIHLGILEKLINESC